MHTLAVAGSFDIIADAEFANMDMLREILGKLQSLKTALRTQTAVVILPRLGC